MRHSLRLAKSKSGVPIHIIQVDAAEIVEFRLYFRAGFAYFSKAEHHVPHMLEHLLFGQNPESDKAQTLAHMLQRLGASGNASTDNNLITIFLTAPLGTAVEALEYILKSVTSPVLSETAIESERQIVLRELYEKYDGLGATVGNELVARLLAPNTPMTPDEEAADILKIDEPMIRGAFADLIVGANLVVVAAGNIAPATEQKIAGLVSLYFEGKHKPERKRLKLEPPEEPVLITNPAGDANNANFVMAVVTETLEAKDRVARNMAANMLFATIDAVVPRTLRSLGYAYSIDMNTVYYDNKSIFLINLAASSEKLPDAITEVYTLLRRYSKAPFPGDEFESISLYAEHILPTVNETPAELIVWYEPAFLDGAKKTAVEEEMKIIKSLTKQDLADTIKRDFVMTDWHWAIISPDSEIWAASLFDKLTGAPARKLPHAKYKKVAVAEVGRIPALTTVAKREFWDSLSQLLFYVLEYPTLLTLLFVATFPNPTGGGAISLFDYLIKSGNVPAGLVIAALAISCTMGYIATRKYVKEINLVLALVGTLAYWYLVVGVFEGLGQGQGFWGTFANIIQPVLFGIAAPLFAIAALRLMAATQRVGGDGKN